MSRRSRHRRVEVDGLAFGAIARAVGSGQRDETVDQPRQSLGLLARTGHVLDGIARADLALEVLEAQSQRGQRSPQLVGGVGHEGLLGSDQVLESPGHLVEGHGQIPHLGRTGTRPDPGGQVAVAQAHRGLTQGDQGLGHPPRQQDAHQGGGAQADEAGAHEHEPVAMDALVDLVGVVGHTDCPRDPTGARHRHGGEHHRHRRRPARFSTPLAVWPRSAACTSGRLEIDAGSPTSLVDAATRRPFTSTTTASESVRRA